MTKPGVYGNWRPLPDVTWDPENWYIIRQDQRLDPKQIGGAGVIADDESG